MCEAVVICLKSIFEDNRYADQVIEKTLKQNPKWGSRDRRFIAETTYDIVRWYRLFKEATNAEEHEYWKLLGGWLVWRQIELPDWEQFHSHNSDTIREKFESNFAAPIKESIPDWLHNLGLAELPLQWEKEINSLNLEAKVVLRVNTLKAENDVVQETLSKEGVETTTDSRFSDALILGKRINLSSFKSFKAGLFEIQDAGSQLISPFLKVEPGMFVIDACAGAGGKTLHLAALMQNMGRIVAMDTEEWKLNELKSRARRAGAHNIETVSIESNKSIAEFEATADRLLLDVPCSGLGVLKRNPDAKWKLSLDIINKVKMLQQQILTDCTVTLKPGGMLVYSTCSILPSENEKQVQLFLKSDPNFELVEEQHIWPSAGFDGFYMALIEKKY